MTAFRRASFAMTYLSFVTSMACVGEETVTSPSTPPGILSRLAAEWNNRRHSAQSGSIEYLEFHNGYSFPPHSREEIHRFFDLVDPGDAEGSIRRFACSVMDREVPPNPPAWPVSTFTFSGDNILDTNAAETAAFNGTDLITSRPLGQGHQLTIGTAPRQIAPAVHTLSSFLWVPEIDPLSPSVSLTDTSPSILSVNIDIGMGAARRHIDVAKSTLDPVAHLAFDTDGRVSEETLQKRFESFDGGVRLPQVTLATRYVGDQLQLLTIRVIKSTSMNKAVSNEAFVLKASPGDVVVDQRARRAKVTTATSAEKVVPSPLPPQEIDQVGSFWTSGVIAVNVLAGILVVLAAWRMYARR